MNSIPRATLVIALAIASVSVVAEGQDRSTADVLRRVEQLERMNADLERRVRELEALLKATPAKAQPTPASAHWRDLSNWRRLRRGMSMEEVRALLGEPERIDGGTITYWRWRGADVYFISDELAGWSEPGR